AVKINDIMNPKVGLRTVLKPPLNPVKTGTPASPTNRYTIIVIAPRRLPRRAPAKKQKNVCNVTGTPPICKNGAQAVILAPILIKATNIPINVRSKTRNCFFVFKDISLYFYYYL